MPESQRISSPDARVVGGLAAALVVGAWVHLLAAVAGGIADAVSGGGSFPPEQQLHLGDILATFGDAGDGNGVLLALLAAAAVWVRVRVDAERPDRLCLAAT